jgi:exonuclease VII small subunit
MKTIESLNTKELLRRAIQKETLDHIDVDNIPEAQLILTRYADLEAYKDNIENAIKGAMDDNPDEKHCSCVPLFKVKIKQLEEKVKTLEVENKRLDIIVKDWVGIDNNYLNHQRQIADLEAQVEQGKRAIELVKECDEYLDSFYKINSIRTYCNLHIKMKELLQPDELTKGER